VAGGGLAVAAAEHSTWSRARRLGLTCSQATRRAATQRQAVIPHLRPALYDESRASIFERLARRRRGAEARRPRRPSPAKPLRELQPRAPVAAGRGRDRPRTASTGDMLAELMTTAEWQGVRDAVTVGDALTSRSPHRHAEDGRAALRREHARSVTTSASTRRSAATPYRATSRRPRQRAQQPRPCAEGGVRSKRAQIWRQLMSRPCATA